jgi:heme oxygenase
MSTRLRLRAATDDIHQVLHGAEPFARIAAGSITAAEYGAVLGMLWRYHTAMSPLCVAGAKALHAPELAGAHAARLWLLKDDLDFLGLAAPSAAAEPVPDDAFAIGCLYTVQGSTLGGKVIARQLDRLLKGANGRRFFLGGPGDSAHWQTLCARLDRADHDFARLEAGSRHAFQRFAGMLAPA